MEDIKDKIDYNFLNKELIKIIERYEGALFGNNIEDVRAMIYETNKTIFTSEVFDAIKKKKPFSIYLSLTDSLTIVERYISEKLPEYKEQYNEYMRNGTFNIFSVDDETIDNRESRSGRIGPHQDINIALEHNYHDPETIIHEFFHSLNYKKRMSEARLYFTETISIFFELDIQEFMKDIGYDEEELKKVKLDRISNTYGCGCFLGDALDFIKLIYNFGEINEDTYQKNIKSGLKIIDESMSETQFYKDAKCLEKNLKQNKDVNAISGFGYILGTVLAFFGLENNLDDYRERFIELNNSINESSIRGSFLRLGIDLENPQTEKMLQSSLAKGLEKIVTKEQETKKSL